MGIFRLKKTKINPQNRYFLKKNRQNRIKRGWKEIVLKTVFWFLLFGFLGLAFWTIIFSRAVRIKSVEVSGRFYGKKITNKDVEEMISGNYFRVLPKNNILLVSKKRLSQAIKDRDETIKDVSIKKIFPEKLSINIVQRKTMLVWIKNNQSYLLDEDGQAFYQPVSMDEGTGEMTIVKDGSEGEIRLGDQVISKEAALFFHELPAKVKDKTGFEIEKELFIPSKMSQEVRVRTKAGWMAFFGLSETAERQANVLKKVLSENIPPEKLGQLEYVDLRLKGRVIYKLKQEKEESEEGDEGVDKKDENS